MSLARISGAATVFQTASLLESFGKVLLKNPDVSESAISENWGQPKPTLSEVRFAPCLGGCLLSGYGIVLSVRALGPERRSICRAFLL